MYIRRPGKTEPTVTAQKPVDPVVKFEVSASKAFHFKFAAAPSQIQLDVQAGDYGKKAVVPIPQAVQNASGAVYGYVAPYAEWGYNKLLKKKSSSESAQ